jgi:DNA-binding HxlR family transcriptional regulator
MQIDTAIAGPPAHLTDPNHCPVETTVQVVGGRWKALILYHLNQGPARFNVIRRLIPGVTQRMLTAHLRELEADGAISRTVMNIVPPHVEYALTPLGQSLIPLLSAMARWGAAVEASRANGSASERGEVSAA